MTSRPHQLKFSTRSLRASMPQCEILSALLLLTLSIPSAHISSANSAEVIRPNIVFILADDLGYGDVGCYGQQRIQTPNIDKLAKEGLRFTDFYAGCTVCAPSRCVLMTGYHTGHAHIRGNAGQERPEIQVLRESDVTVAQELKTAGYSTALCGKWGLGDEGTIS